MSILESELFPLHRFSHSFIPDPATGHFIVIPALKRSVLSTTICAVTLACCAALLWSSQKKFKTLHGKPTTLCFRQNVQTSTFTGTPRTDDWCPISIITLSNYLSLDTFSIGLVKSLICLFPSRLAPFFRERARFSSPAEITERVNIIQHRNIHPSPLSELFIPSSHWGMAQLVPCKVKALWLPHSI